MTDYTSVEALKSIRESVDQGSLEAVRDAVKVILDELIKDRTREIEAAAALEDFDHH
ncbi:hypothetical protein NKY44_16930 [Sinorhizobium meliloti]|uniref:hypothetical protein n=1 Tax=Rhizobium meliloti TaxID=382 RepID=UPI003D65EE8D